MFLDIPVAYLLLYITVYWIILLTRAAYYCEMYTKMYEGEKNSFLGWAATRK